MTSILKVDTIQDADGNNIINESGNTITIGASGDTTNIVGTLQNNGAGVGGANTPIVVATRTGSTQSISSGSYTKVELNSEILDTGSIYDTSTYTITIGETAKYFIGAMMQVSNLNGTSDFAVMRVADSSNTSSKRYINIAMSGDSGYGYAVLAGQTIRSLSAGETVCLFVYGSEAINVVDDNVQLVLYKIIE